MLGLRAVPLESESGESLVSLPEQLIVVSDDAQSAKREGVEDGRIVQERRHLALDEVRASERRERIAARRDRPEPQTFVRSIGLSSNSSAKLRSPRTMAIRSHGPLR